MSPRRGWFGVAAAVVAAVLALPVAAEAAAQPDVRAMALQAADLPAGSRIVEQGRVRGNGVIAGYQRSFQLPGRRIGRTRAIALTQVIVLTKSAEDAQGMMILLALGSDSPTARQAIGQEVLRAAGRRGRVRARQVSIGSPRGRGVGDLVFVEHVAVKTPRGSVQAVFAGVTVDRVISTLLMVARPGTPARGADALPVLRLVAGRLRTSLLPHELAPPSIAGTVQVGETLTAGTGRWDPATAPTGYAYQWERCDATGANCHALPGATGQAYNVANADRAATIRVAVTAGNPVGRATAVSAPTAVVP